MQLVDCGTTVGLDRLNMHTSLGVSCAYREERGNQRVTPCGRTGTGLDSLRHVFDAEWALSDAD